MHPLLSRRGALGLYLLIWTLLSGLAILLACRPWLGWLEALAMTGPMAVTNAFIGLSAWYLNRSYSLRHTSLAKLAGVACLAAVVSSLLWVSIGFLWANLLAELPPLGDAQRHFGAIGPLLLGIGALLYLLALGLHYLLAAMEESEEAARLALQLQAQTREAELRAIKAQLHPHFLFNSLNSISALALPQPAEARRMCLQLADFLRQSLDLGARQYLSLREELNLVRAYLAIEQVRFQPRLRVSETIGDECLDCQVPALILQPLVENAIVHGIARTAGEGTLSLWVSFAVGSLIIRVENHFDPEAPPGRRSGRGTAMVRERVRSLYGGAGRLDLATRDGRFVATLVLPARRAGEEKQP